MVTLANVQGSSLALNIADAVREDIAGFQERGRVADAQADLEESLRVALGGAPTDAKPSKGLGVLGQLAPGIAQMAGQLNSRRDPQGTEAFRAEAKTGLALSQKIIDAKSPLEKQRLLADEVARVSGEGGDVTRLVKLANMDEDQLDLELQKMQLVGEGMLKAVPEVKGNESLNFFSTPARRNAFARIAATNPKIASSLLAGRDRQLARAQSAAAARTKAAAAAAAPKTDLGKTLTAIASDERSGVITPQAATQLRGKARAEQLAPTSKGKLPAGWRFKENGDAEPIPGGPATAISGEIAAKFGLINTALSNFDEAEKFLTKEFQPGDFIETTGAFGEGGIANRAIRFSVEAVLRAVSGAAVPDTEVERFMDLFAPKSNDRVATAKQKLSLLRETLENTRSAISQGRGGVPGEAGGFSGVTVGGIKFTVNP